MDRHALGFHQSGEDPAGKQPVQMRLFARLKIVSHDAAALRASEQIFSTLTCILYRLGVMLSLQSQESAAEVKHFLERILLRRVC
jgi:hypothetical protein